MIADDAATRLGRLDSCAVSDALDRLGLAGAVRGLAPLWPCPRIVGRAVTVKIKPAGLERSKRHLCTSAIAAAARGDVIVVDNGGRVDVAAWGGLLSLAAQLKELGGVILHGGIMEQSCNEEIECAGVQVHPGDLVIADGSGVVFIPRARENDVIAVAEALAEREAGMAAAIRSGRSNVEVMEGMGYESMLAPQRSD